MKQGLPHHRVPTSTSILRGDLNRVQSTQSSTVSALLAVPRSTSAEVSSIGKKVLSLFLWKDACRTGVASLT